MEEIKWIALPQMPNESNQDILVLLNLKSCWMGRYEGGRWALYFSDAGLAKAEDPHLKMITHWALLPKGPTK